MFHLSLERAKLVNPNQWCSTMSDWPDWTEQEGEAFYLNVAQACVGKSYYLIVWGFAHVLAGLIIQNPDQLTIAKVIKYMRQAIQKVMAEGTLVRPN